MIIYCQYQSMLQFLRGKFIQQEMNNKVVDRNSVQRILKKRKVLGSLQYRILWKNKIKSWEKIANLGMKFQKKHLTYQQLLREKHKNNRYSSTGPRILEVINIDKNQEQKQKRMMMLRQKNEDKMMDERQESKNDAVREKEEYEKKIKRIVRVRYNKSKKMEQVLVIFNDEQESEKWQDKEKVRKLATSKLLQFYEFFCDQLKSFKIVKQ